MNSHISLNAFNPALVGRSLFARISALSCCRFTNPSATKALTRPATFEGLTRNSSARVPGRTQDW